MTTPEPELANRTSVPVPAGRRMRLAIKRWLPIVFFGLSCFTCSLLWQFQQQAIVVPGEVEIVEVTINSAENGIVSQIVPSQPPSGLTYASVDKDELVAVLDDRFLKERLSEASRNADALKIAVQANGELKSLESAVVQLEKKSAILAATMELRGLGNNETESRQELSFELEKLRANLGSATQDSDDIAADDSVAVQFAKQKLRALENELSAISVSVGRLDARSPIEGRVTKLHVAPGDSVTTGQPLLTLSPVQGSYAVAHLREGSAMEPFIGMPVTIRTRTVPVREFESRVESVGPAVESIPARQRMVAQMEEWGRPIRVKIPASMKLVPGSLVEVVVDAPAATAAQ